MKVSIISTIAATLLAASSAAPFDTLCQSQTDNFRQHQIDALPQFITVLVTFCAGLGPDPVLAEINYPATQPSYNSNNTGKYVDFFAYYQYYDGFRAIIWKNILIPITTMVI